MKYSHVFLDFDETLFNHLAYAEWADDWLAQKFDKPSGFFKDRFWEFHQQLDDPLLRLYRHDDHSRAATGRGWDYLSGELEKAYLERAEDFCYPDAHALLEELSKLPVDVRVLTFGDDGYQRYKLGFCKVLKQLAIPVHVVHEPKRAFLARDFGDIKRGVLVDDKYPLKLPDKWDEIWIDRSSSLSKSKPLDKKTTQISALRQVSDII